MPEHPAIDRSDQQVVHRPGVLEDRVQRDEERNPPPPLHHHRRQREIEHVVVQVQDVGLRAIDDGADPAQVARAST